MLNPEEWKTLKESYWPGVIEELNMYIKDAETKLRVCKPEELRSHQELIKAFETMKQLPDNAIERLS